MKLSVVIIEHPESSFLKKNKGKIIGGGVGIAAGLVAIPVALPLLGFAARHPGLATSGVIAGSAAAGIQSTVYGGSTTGVFSVLQSWGAAGVAESAQAALSGVAGTIGTIIGAGIDQFDAEQQNFIKLLQNEQQIHLYPNYVYVKLTSGKTKDKLVTDLYTNLFGRTVDSSEISLIYKNRQFSWSDHLRAIVETDVDFSSGCLWLYRFEPVSPITIAHLRKRIEVSRADLFRMSDEFSRIYKVASYFGINLSQDENVYSYVVSSTRGSVLQEDRIQVYNKYFASKMPKFPDIGYPVITPLLNHKMKRIKSDNCYEWIRTELKPTSALRALPKNDSRSSLTVCQHSRTDEITMSNMLTALPTEENDTSVTFFKSLVMKTPHQLFKIKMYSQSDSANLNALGESDALWKLQKPL